MNIALIRHGIAEDPSGIANDADRALTGRGRRKMAIAARGLASVLPEPDAIVTSPYRRARDTADILAGVWSEAPILTRSTLCPGHPPETCFDILTECGDARLVVIVGHAPGLEQWAALALTGSRDTFLGLRKGGAALLTFGSEPGAGGACLTWLLPPRVLRALGRGGS